ncbi:hypothetical protein ES703_68192 [subsurface metagenome]
MIEIELLTDKTLREAVNLLNRVFQNEEEEAPGDELPASLNPKKYKDFLLETQISELRYWVAIDNTGKVVGTTGLYCYSYDEHEAYWLGWFCVHPDLRKRGIGNKLLRFSIVKARKSGKKFLRLYTSTNPNELNAHRLYKKHGFRLFKKESLGDTDLKKLYYELKL